MASKSGGGHSGEKRTIYRDSESGQITTKDYANKHPRTTEKERVPTGNK